MSHTIHTYCIIFYTFDQPWYVCLNFFEMVGPEVHFVVMDLYSDTVRFSALLSSPYLTASNIVFDFLTITEIGGDILIGHNSKTSSTGWAENPSYYMWINDHFSPCVLFHIYQNSVFLFHSQLTQSMSQCPSAISCSHLLYYCKVTQYCHQFCQLTFYSLL